MMIVTDYEAVAKRAEQLEREGAREMRLRAEARAVAGYEPGDVEATDGSEIIIADDDIRSPDSRDREWNYTRRCR